MRPSLLACSLTLSLALPAWAEDVPHATPRVVEVQPSGQWAWGILLPGLGQIVLGDPLKGSLFFVGAVGLPVAGYFAGQSLADSRPPVSFNSSGNPLQDLVGGSANVTGTYVADIMLWGGLGLMAGLGLWTWAGMDAYFLDREKARQKALQTLNATDTLVY